MGPTINSSFPGTTVSTINRISKDWGRFIHSAPRESPFSLPNPIGVYKSRPTFISRARNHGRMEL
jgi:hypothetical protein